MSEPGVPGANGEGKKRNPESPGTLYVAAWSYRNAMTLLVDHVETEGHHNLNAPYYLLAGFALELALKAPLLATGVSRKEVTRIRHSLAELMEAAFAVGLAPTDRDELERVIRLLQTPHADFQMRYIPADVAEIPLPTPRSCLTAVSDVVKIVPIQFPVIGLELSTWEEDREG